MTPSYIATNIEELLDSAPPYIQEIIQSDEINATTITLCKIYQIPVGSSLALSNIITLILIGALKPEDVVRALQDVLLLSPDIAYKLAEDLEKSILQKARISILGKPGGEVKTLVYEGEKTPDELRKEILDTTKRESGLVKDQTINTPTSPPPKKQVVLTPGSRSQLLEQLQLLGAIPDDEEVETRLDHLREQMAGLDKKEETTLDSNIALQEFMFGDKGRTTAPAEARAATYSKAPTKYNVDPYRETAEE